MRTEDVEVRSTQYYVYCSKQYGAVSTAGLTLGRPKNGNDTKDDEFCSSRSGSCREKETIDLQEVNPATQP